MAPRKVPREEEFFLGMGLQIVTGIRYLGGFIGYGSAEKRWLVRKIERWAESVGTLAGEYRKHPQSTYSGLQKSLQQEWAFSAIHPNHRRRLRPSIEGAAGDFLHVPIQGIVRRGTRERGHVPANETGGTGPSGPDKDDP